MTIDELRNSFYFRFLRSIKIGEPNFNCVCTLLNPTYDMRKGSEVGTPLYEFSSSFVITQAFLIARSFYYKAGRSLPSGL